MMMLENYLVNDVRDFFDCKNKKGKSAFWVEEVTGTIRVSGCYE